MIVAEVVEILLPHILDAKPRPYLASQQHGVSVTQICATPEMEMTHVVSIQHG